MGIVFVQEVCYKNSLKERWWWFLTESSFIIKYYHLAVLTTTEKKFVSVASIVQSIIHQPPTLPGVWSQVFGLVSREINSELPSLPVGLIPTTPCMYFGISILRRSSPCLFTRFPIYKILFNKLEMCSMNDDFLLGVFVWSSKRVSMSSSCEPLPSSFKYWWLPASIFWLRSAVLLFLYPAIFFAAIIAKVSRNSRKI